MNTISFRPAKRFLVKLYLGSLLVNGILLIVGLTIFFGQQGKSFNLMPLLLIVGGLQLLIWLFNTIYYFTIRYEIHPDEVIVRSGILTRTVKHVPFRTVTNITTTRDFLDQIIGIGSLSIQTAGSGSAIPEEKLVGIAELQELYSYVAQELRRFRSSLSPTQANSDTSPTSDEVMFAILDELKAIRRLLQQP